MLINDQTNHRKKGGQDAILPKKRAVTGGGPAAEARPTFQGAFSRSFIHVSDDLELTSSWTRRSRHGVRPPEGGERPDLKATPLLRAPWTPGWEEMRVCVCVCVLQ